MSALVSFGLAAALSLVSIAAPVTPEPAPAQTAVTRHLAWDGSTRLVVNLGSDVTFV